MPAPVGVFNFLLRANRHLHPQKMRHPGLQHLRQRLQARAGTRHRQHQAVAQIVADLMGEIEQEVVAPGLRPVTMRIAIVQHLQADIAHRRLALCQEPADIAQTASLVE